MPTISAVIKYATNLDELRRELASGTDQLVVLEKAAERTTRNLGGEGLMRAAHNAAAAVQSLGGASKLTASEQDKVNNLLTRAIEKYQALGQTAPAQIRKLHEETTKVVAVTEQMPAKTLNWTNAVMGLGSALGVTLSIGAVVGFAKEMLRAGDEIQKMADKTSIGTENVQRLDFVATQAGVSFEGIVSAVQNLQQRLGDNDKGAIGALAKLGINLDAFLKLDPYEQFVQLSEAIGRIPDPTQRAATAADVFGKSWKEIGPAVVSNIRDIATSAPVMADATVKSLDQAGDAIDKFWRMVKSNAGNQLGLAILSVQALPREVNMAFKAMHLDVEGAKKDIQSLAQWWDVLVQKVEQRPTVGISQQVKNLFSGGPGVPQVRLSPDDVKGIEADLNRERKALDDASKAADEHAKAIKQLADTYSGLKVIQAAKDALEAVNKNLKDGIDISDMTEEQQVALNKTVTAAIDVYRALGKQAPESLIAIQNETQKVIDVQDNAKLALDEWADSVKQHNEEYKRGEEETVAFLEAMEKERLDTAKSALDDYAEVVKRHQNEQKQGEEDTLKAIEEVQRKRKEHIAQIGRDLDNLAGTLMTVGNAFNNMFGAILTGVGQSIRGIRELRSATTDLGKVASGIDFGFSFMQSAIAFLEHDTLTAKFVKGVTDAYGGVKEFRRQAALAGVSVDRLFSTTSLTTFKRELSIVEAAIKRYQEIQGQISAKQNELLQAQQTVLEKTTSVLEKYGLTWRDAGREFQDAHLDEDANQLYEDMQLLQRAGVDNGVIFAKMRDKIQAYLADATKYASSVTEGFGKVIQAMIETGNFTDVDYKKLKDYADAAAKAGTEIPESWKPIIQTLIDMGYYTDQNGDGIVDLTDTGIIFAKTTTQGFQSVVDKLDEIVQALKELEQQLHHVEVQAGRTRGELEKIGTAIPRPVPGQTPAPSPSPSEGESPDSGTAIPRPASTGGYVTPFGVQRFGGGGVATAEHYGRGSSLVRFMPQGTDVVPAMLTPGEGVLSVDAMNLLGRVTLDALNAGRVSSNLLGDTRRGAVQGVVILQMDRREVARGIVDVFPGETHRLGVRVVSS